MRSKVEQQTCDTADQHRDGLVARAGQGDAGVPIPNCDSKASRGPDADTMANHNAKIMTKNIDNKDSLLDKIQSMSLENTKIAQNNCDYFMNL